MKRLLLLFLCAVASSGCHHQTVPVSSGRAELPSKLDGVTVADGISKSEAEIISDYYSQKIGCGGFTGIRDGGSVWIVDGQVGYAAKPVSFNIDKASGKRSALYDR